jgi:hypothetical protein
MSHEERQAVENAETAYEALLARLRSDPSEIERLADDIKALQDAGHREHLPKKQAERVRRDLFSGAAEAVLADDRLTVAEEKAFSDVANALGLAGDALDSFSSDLRGRLVVAAINDGRLPVIPQPHLLARPGESVHLETVAQLLKTVAVREFQAGMQGVSLRIAKGVYWRVGAARGHTVTVGERQEVAAVGVLSVTSRRVVFSGDRKTLEFQYPKLTSADVFNDGIRLGVTNRQNPSTFLLDHVDAVAAAITAAAQREG